MGKIRPIAVAVLCLSGCAFQSASKLSEPQTGAFGAASSIDMEGQEDVRGELQKVDGDRLVVHTADGTVELRTTGETLVFSDGEVGKLSDLREGQPVRASIREDGGRDVALWVETPRARKAPEESGAHKGQKTERADKAGKETTR
jgi:hypothetical protein